MSNECIDTIANVFSAIGTVASVIMALYFATSETRRRDREEKRMQANLVAGWVGGDKEKDESGFEIEMSCLTIVNNSSLPVFNLVAVPVIEHRSVNIPVDENIVAKVKVFPPGKYLAYIGFLDHVMGNKEFTLEISFKDSFGNSWIRRSDGKLDELKIDPLVYYKIERPFGSSSIEKID